MSVLTVDQVYVTHYSPLSDRRKAMESALRILGIDATWITAYDQEVLTEEYLGACVQRLDSSVIDRAVYFEHVDLRHHYRTLNAAEISLSLKHIEALRCFCSSGGALALILEDDVLFCRDFVEQCNRFLSETPQDFGIIFPGDGCGFRVPPSLIRPDQVAYRVQPPLAKCTDSYIVTHAAAWKLLNKLLPIFLPPDTQLTYWLRSLGIATYWWEPNLITQGSQVGIYESVLRDRAGTRVPEPLTPATRQRWLITTEE